MEFTEPYKMDFTVYTKSGCRNCSKVKALLDEYDFNYSRIECDEYLLDNRDDFLQFICEKADCEVQSFPMVFHDGVYIGGYQETKKYIETFLSFF